MRMAALFHLFLGKSGDISAEDMKQAITLMHWYMQEARRLLEPGSTIHPHLVDARTLLKWLLERREGTLSPREILQKSPLRTTLQRDNALEILIEKHHIRLIKKGNATLVVLNPCYQ